MAPYRLFDMRTTLVKSALMAAIVTGLALPAGAQVALDKSITVTGQGSTFLSNFVDQCKADVKNIFGINIGYQPTGSGAGRSGFISNTVEFGGSDVPFNATELGQLKDKKFVYIPITIGGIAVVYKLPGVTDLKLSAPTLARIFAGELQKWNAEPIAKDNPGVNLPDSVIKVVVRSDSSGTSNVFSDYLSSAGKGGWTKGAQSTFPVPSGNGVAQRGSDGVTNYVQGSQGEGAITYAEVSFATERKLNVAKVINTAGSAVGPDAENVSEAMASAAINDDGTLLLNFNALAARAYPISTTSYLIAPLTLDLPKADVLRTFLTYSLGACQAKAEKIGYAPLPANLVALGQKALEKVVGSGPVPTVPAAGAPATTAASASASTAPASSAATTATTVPATTKATTVTTKAKAKAKTKTKTKKTTH